MSEHFFKETSKGIFISQVADGSGVTRGGREGWTALDDTLQGLIPDLKLIFLWLNLERTLDKRHGKIGVVKW